MKGHILLVEDDRAIASFLRQGLLFEGYSVAAVGTGEEALSACLLRPPDAIILDRMLPGMDGLEVMRRLRDAGKEMPILMLTARESVPDRVAGLKAGADDYLVKPFALEELLARMEALLRRQEGPRVDGLTLETLVLDPLAHMARRGERSLALTAKEFELLEYFLRHPRQVLTREQLYSAVWDDELGPESNVVEVFVRNLRSKLEAEGEARLLHTVRGVGYVLREDAPL